MAQPGTVGPGNANSQWTDDQLKQQINDIYQQELGRDADPDGAANLFKAARGGANIDTDLRSGLQSSDEYKQRQTANAAPAPAASATPPAGTPPPAAVPQGQPAAQAAATRAVQYATNPQLDDTMAQMLQDSRARQAKLDAANDQMRTTIMGQYDKANQPIDPNDPILSSLKQVHDAANQRARNAGQEAMAARGATEGTPTGANDAQVQSSYEKMGQDNAAYAANTDYTELNNRRDQIDKMLSLGSGVLTADEANTLQRSLGSMSGTLQSLGQKSGAYLGGAGIDNQNSQFYDGMANNDSMQTALMNQYFMQMLTGGGGS